MLRENKSQKNIGYNTKTDIDVYQLFNNKHLNTHIKNMQSVSIFETGRDLP